MPIYNTRVSIVEEIDGPDPEGAITRLAGQLREAGFNVMSGDSRYADAFLSENNPGDDKHLNIPDGDITNESAEGYKHYTEADFLADAGLSEDDTAEREHTRIAFDTADKPDHPETRHEQ